MIQELVNYTKWLKDDFPEIFEGKLSEGIHILIDIDETGEIIENSYQSEVFKKDKEPSHFLNKLKAREIVSNALGNNKGIIDKVIFSNNPYSVFFKIYFTASTDKTKVLDKEKFKNFRDTSLLRFENNESNFDKIKDELVDTFIKPQILSVIKNDKKSIPAYFFKIENDFFELEESDIEYIYLKNIQEYMAVKFIDDVIRDPNFLSMFISLDKNFDKEKLEIQDYYFDKYIKVNFNVPFNILKKASNRYFSEKIFNITKYNKLFNGANYGLSNFFNKSAEDKKIFNLHRSSYFMANELVEISDALYLNEFLNSIDSLPKVLPVFIDKNELNYDVITLFKNDNNRGYKEIIAIMASQKKRDLNNYYLLNFSKKEIRDFDFVSTFKYFVQMKRLSSLEEIFEKYKSPYEIDNIFDIENIIDSEFIVQIHRETKKESGFLSDNYFFSPSASKKDVVQKKHFAPKFVKENYYKYRKLLYDAFYKSRLYLISASIVKHICMPVIHYEIENDETENKKSKFENRIIRKILLYIQLNEIFDKEHINFGGIDMASELPRYRDNCLNLVKGKIDSYKSDEDFAFGTGQLIRYLLELSESSNKNHSMFAPFLQKLGNFNVFISQINKAMMTYGHKIKMNYDTVDRLMSNTTGYTLENGKTLKSLETLIICGYFAKSVIEEVVKEKRDSNSKGDK
ncbi:MAG: hypothetical protein RBR08_03235 [Desulforegulaceae bacterium]|nr:hypothetical protein [Desulforegulaceae bacterium]